MKKIVITTICHKNLIECFWANGFQVDYKPGISYGELFETIGDYEGIIIATGLKIDAIIIDRAHKLKWIGRLGSGMEMIDVEYAKTKNIFSFSSPEGNRQAVAEHCLAMLLGAMNNVYKSFNEVKNYKWLREENRGEEIAEKTIGIIGYGNTGRAFTNLLLAFNPQKILVYDKYKKDFNTALIQQSSLDDLLSNSDIVSLHLPLSKETFHFANEMFFKQIKQGCYFINSSRGQVVDTVSLLNSLNESKFKAVLLDVLENEQIANLSNEEKKIFDKLTSFPNVLLTPHIAGYSTRSLFKVSDVLIKKLHAAKLI